MVDTVHETVLLALSSSLTLSLVVVVAGDVGDDVHGPASNLLTDQVEKSSDWSLLSQLVQLVSETTDLGGILVSCLWDENHVSFHVTGGLVVLAVGDLPREVWDQQRRVAEPADGVVENLAWRERLVTTFVGQHPQSCSKESLHEGVCTPQSSSDSCVGNVFWSDEPVCKVERRS